MNPPSLTYVLITPARNEQDFIELTLQAVISQTLRPLRWIIVSDGSTDATDDIVKRYAARHDWIELYRMPERKERHFGGKVACVKAGYERLKELPWDVIGSLDDPAKDPLFSDLAFMADFAPLTARYPAQLHVNLDADWRGRGIGSRLVAAFAEAAQRAGCPGVHVVTARGMRNVGFYLANGFRERGATVIDGKELLFLGRDLAGGD